MIQIVQPDPFATAPQAPSLVPIVNIPRAQTSEATKSIPPIAPKVTTEKPIAPEGIKDTPVVESQTEDRASTNPVISLPPSPLTANRASVDVGTTATTAASVKLTPNQLEIPTIPKTPERVRVDRTPNSILRVPPTLPAAQNSASDHSTHSTLPAVLTIPSRRRADTDSVEIMGRAKRARTEPETYLRVPKLPTPTPQAPPRMSNQPLGVPTFGTVTSIGGSSTTLRRLPTESLFLAPSRPTMGLPPSRGRGSGSLAFSFKTNKM
ncbi:hypothetical protein B0H16DRAFT_1505990 [Mycena metata]|uniref:Uncharacterized protein n=1 Tax=Mycena metata TaxID=1033252 RepID=A0AAD7K1B5_9AGAR|nr:hypothetical protein B0H16DRAFT_1505990 [Mycena metata]